MQQEIKPTYVTFEQAKWLKEKEFDIKCKNYYVEGDKELNEGFDHEYWGDYRCINWNADVIGIKPFDGFSSAPEQWQLVEWLLVNHGIWVFLERGLEPVNFYPVIDNNHKVTSFKYHPPMWYNSPQEAYSAAFDYIKENNLI
jgi:hypothetical protein